MAPAQKLGHITLCQGGKGGKKRGEKKKGGGERKGEGPSGLYSTRGRGSLHIAELLHNIATCTVYMDEYCVVWSKGPIKAGTYLHAIMYMYCIIHV